MKKALLVVIILFCAAQAFSQGRMSDSTIVDRIRSEEASHSQVGLIAHYLTDVSGPRLTNSPGYRRASSWAVQTLAGWGLQNSKLEPWGLFGKGWSLEKCNVSLQKPYYKPLIALPRAWTVGTEKDMQAQVILLDRLDSASIKNAISQIKGKIVVIRTSDTLLRSAFGRNQATYPDSILNTLPDSYMFPREMMGFYVKYFLQQYHLEQYLKAVGAVALLSFNGSSRDGTIGLNGTEAYRKDFETSIPQLVVSKEDYLEVQRLLQDGTPVSMDIDVKTKWYEDDLNGYNVVAEIQGTDPMLKSEIVMIGGHLDSWHGATGATDNAAGCAVMLEAIRLIQSLGIKPRRTIRIALWSGEEQGLLGSFGYVKKHFGNPADMMLKPEQQKVSVYFNLDNGSGKIRGIYLQNNEAARTIFTNWLKPFARDGATGITSSNTGSTDHISFDAVGIPAFQFIQDPLEYESRTHHTNMDTYDHLQLNDLKQAATIVAVFVYNAAMMNEKIPRKALPKAERFVFDVDLAK